MKGGLPQSLLRKVETHVRVMSFPEHFEHTTRAPGGEHTVTFRPPPSSNEAAVIPTNYQTSFSGFTRVHQNYTTSLDNELFYQDVLRKIVPSALAGQSFTVLFCGAPGSGRSQTMYTIDARRDGGNITHGMLHYLARDLLDKPNVRVLVSAFNVREKKIFDTLQQQGDQKREVQIRNLHSPLGAVPECSSILLEKPEDAMIVPNHKYKDGSCFIQFEIYHQMGTVVGGGGAGGASPASGAADATTTTIPSSFDAAHATNSNTSAGGAQRKGAFSLITFVDVAQFDQPLPRDVIALRGSIDRHLQGGDPQFGNCRLSELLESSICRGRSLIGIATVIGQPQIFPHTAAALGFVEQLSKIEQVATVCQFVHPRWLTDLPAKIRELDVQHEDRCRRNYDRGFSEVYHAFRNAFVAKLHEVEHFMAANSEAGAELAERRGDLKKKLELALQQLEAAARDEERRIECNLTKADQLREECERAARAVQQDSDVLQAKQHELYVERSRVEKEQAEVSHELAIHDEALRRSKRTLEELQRNIDADIAIMREAKKNTLKVQDRIKLHWSQYNYESALAKITAAKERAAAQLSDATARAVIQDQSQRAERQRKTAPPPSLMAATGGYHHSSGNNNSNLASTTMMSHSSQGGSTRLGSTQHHQQQQQQQQNLSLGRRGSGPTRRERSEEAPRQQQVGAAGANPSSSSAAPSRVGSQQQVQ